MLQNKRRIALFKKCRPSESYRSVRAVVTLRLRPVLAGTDSRSFLYSDSSDVSVMSRIPTVDAGHHDRAWSMHSML